MIITSYYLYVARQVIFLEIASDSGGLIDY